MPLVRVPGIGNVQFPDDMPQEQIIRAIESDVIPQYEAMIKPSSSPVEALKGGAKRAGSTALTGFAGLGDATEAAQAGLARQQAITERPGFSEEYIKYLYETQGLLPAAKETFREIPNVVAEQFPNLAAAYGGFKLGSAATAALPIPHPGIKAGVTALGGLAGMAFPSYFEQAGANIERQAQEQQAKGEPISVDKGAAYSAAVPQAALDVVGDRLAFGRILGIPAKAMGTEAAEAIAQRGLMRTLAGGAAKTTLSEVPTEVTQQMFERLQAGLPLTSDDALTEYRQTAFQTAMLAPLGGAEGVVGRSQARDVVAADKQRQDELNRQLTEQGRAETEALRGADLAGLSLIQQNVDIEGMNAVQEEIARQAQETRQKMTDTLRSVMEQKEAAADPIAAGVQLSTKEGIRDALNPDNFDTYFPVSDYSNEDRNVIRNDLKNLMKQVPTQAQVIKQQDEAVTRTQREETEAGLSKTFSRVFGEHTMQELGIPKSKKNVELLEPFFGKVTSASPIELNNALEEIKMRNKGPKDEEINFKIDDYVSKSLSPALNQATAQLEADPNWRERMKAGFVDVYGDGEVSDQGYRFTTGQEYQPDLFQPGESMNLSNVYQREEEPNAAPSYTPSEQLGLEFGPEGDRTGLERADVGAGTEPRYDRAEPLTVGPARGTTTPDVTGTRPEYSTLGFDEKAGKRIERLLTDKTRTTPEQQAEAVNKIAKEYKRIGNDLQTAVDKANEISLQYAKWPAQKAKATPAEEKRARYEAGEVALLDEDEDYYNPMDLLGRKKKRPTEAPKVVERAPTTADKIARTYSSIFGGAKGAPTIVQTYDELPEQYREKARDKMAAFTDPKTGRDYYVADSIREGDELGIILHEKGAHLGLKKLIGQDRINALVNQVYKWASQPAKTKEQKVAQRIATEAMERADESGEKIGSNRHTEEVIAYFTDIAVNKYKINPTKSQPKENSLVVQWLRDLWSRVLGTMKKLNYNPDQLTPNDVVELVYGAARIEGIGKAPATEEAGEVVGRKKSDIEPTQQELADATANNRTFFTKKGDYTLEEKARNVVGNNVWGWLANKLVGGGEAFRLKGTSFFGPEARLNPDTGRELGYLNEQRAVQDTNTATNGVAMGYLDVDKEGVISVREADENIIALNGLANNIKEAMVRDGMSQAAANDAFTHMTVADRFRELQSMGVLSRSEFSDADYAYGKELQKRYAAEYKEWQDMYQTMRKRTLDLLVKTGVFTQKKADEFMNRFEYIPFQREQDPNVSDGVFMRSLLSAKREFRIKGSNREIKDVMENILDNQVWLMKRAIRNNAANLIAETMESMNRANPLLGGEYTFADDKSPNTVEFLKDGELVKFKVLDPNDAVIFSAAPAMSSLATKIMRSFTSALRKGVTLMPSFQYSQILQDAMRAPLVSGTKEGVTGTLKKSVPQFFQNIRGETETAKTLRKYGIVGAIDYQDTYDNFKKETLGEERKGIGRVLELGERTAQANDLATRAAVYDNLIKEGVSPNEASLRALMMINFQNRGHSQFINYLIALAPFVNSRIQGNYRLLMALQGKIPGVTKAQAKQAVAWRLSKLAAFSALYAMAVSGDDDYERANEEVKNHNFLLGGLKVPVAPELLPVKIAAEKAYRLASDQTFETAEKAAKAEIGSLASLAFGIADVTPTMLKPVLENMTNYSFFTGRDLVGYNLRMQESNMQYNDNTSEIAKWLSNTLYDAGEAIGLSGDMTAVSPIKIDNLVRGWFGSMGRDFLYTTDMLSGEKPTPKLNQLPLAAGFFYDTEGGGLKSDFYELRDKSTRAYNTWKNHQKTDPEKARDYLENHRDLISIHKPLETTADLLTKFNQQKRRLIARDPDTAREQVDEINTRVHELLSNRLPAILQRAEEVSEE
jgi:hypothetical protein